MPITINNETLDEGCYVESHQGQYGPDLVFDLAVSLGFPVPSVSSDMHWLRKVAERKDERFWTRYHDPAVAMRRDVLRLLASSGPAWKVTPDPKLRHDGDPECDNFPMHGLWEHRHDLLDEIEEWLNDNTTGGTWGWDDGDFFLEYADDPDTTYVWVCQDCYMAHHYGATEHHREGYDHDTDEDVTYVYWTVGDDDRRLDVEPLSSLMDEGWHYADAVNVERRFGETGEDPAYKYNPLFN